MKNEIKNFFNDGDYRNTYNHLVKNHPEEDHDSFESFDQCIDNICTAVVDNNGDIDAAISIWDDMIQKLEFNVASYED